MPPTCPLNQNNLTLQRSGMDVKTKQALKKFRRLINRYFSLCVAAYFLISQSLSVFVFLYCRLTWNIKATTATQDQTTGLINTTESSFTESCWVQTEARHTGKVWPLVDDLLNIKDIKEMKFSVAWSSCWAWMDLIFSVIRHYSWITWRERESLLMPLFLSYFEDFRWKDCA